MQEKDKSNLILLLLIIILVAVFFVDKHEPTFALVPSGEVAFIWKINTRTGEVSLCVMPNRYKEQPPVCSPWSESDRKKIDE